ncbi:response regulator [Zavarzinella formosa]|uniref:response regulator n=1 Tax=Zavarzinella formosa TaxID=360055 RepID=UPI0003741F99|nr:response regulator [Zavarzinella formosa]
MTAIDELSCNDTEDSDQMELPSVLVVDDSPVFRLIVSNLIRTSCGYTTFTVGNGREAVEFLKEQTPSMVLTDLHMPEMDGLELVEYVRENHQSIPIVLMTAEGSEDTALRALQSGAASYVPKKRLKSDLGEILQQVLHASRTDRRKQQLLQSLSHRDSMFVLENDTNLVPLLIAMFQEELTATELCGSANRTRIGVALEEAMLNGIYHGNLEVSSELKQQGNAFHDLAERRRILAPYSSRRLHVRCQLTPEKVIYTIRDEGPGFDVANLPDPTDPANLERPSGRGMLLIRMFMDDVRYNATGNEITLEKKRDVAK